MRPPRSAAIYIRTSPALAAEGFPLERQLAECRRFAQSRGRSVSAEYIDDSALPGSGRLQPAFELLLADILDRRVAALVVFHPDAIHPDRATELADVCAAVPFPPVESATGSNIGLGSGAPVSAERVLRSVNATRVSAALAANGLPEMGGARPFGFESDRVTVREGEAEVIREVAARFVAGESVRSLAVWMTGHGVRPARTAAAWSVTVLRTILASGRIAGLREAHGVVVGAASWPAIITPEVHTQILARLGARTRAASNRARFLLSGLLWCGRCGSHLQTRSPGRRLYVCALRSEPPGGCGRVAVVAVPVEAWVAAQVCKRLVATARAEIRAGRQVSHNQFVDMAVRIRTAEADLRGFAEMVGVGELTRAEYQVARARAVDRRGGARRELEHAAGAAGVDAVLADREILAATWRFLDLATQRSIVAGMLDHAIVAPVGTNMHNYFLPSRVTLRWRKTVAGAPLASPPAGAGVGGIDR